MTSSSVCACLRFPPADSRPIIRSHELPAFLSRWPQSPFSTWGIICIGHQRSGFAPTSNPKKSGGVTPTMVNGASSNRIVLPTTAGSAPNRRCQKLWLITATACGLPTRSSSAVKVRPSVACTPSTAKKLPVTSSAWMNSGSFPPSPEATMRRLKTPPVAKRPERLRPPSRSFS